MRRNHVIERVPAVAPDAAEARARGLKLPRTFAALANYDYRMLWIGTLGSSMAMNMNMIARGYLAYQLSGSAAILGAVSLARALPQVVFTLFGGVFADRVNKRRLMLYTQSTSGLILLSTAMLVHSGLITIWLLVLLGFLEGSIFAFNMPARQALVPELVEPKDVMNAVALSNASMNATSIIGPSLAGLLISLPFIGLTYVFYFMAACYIIPVFMITQITPRFVGRARKHGSVLQEFRGGLSYVFHHDVLAMLLLIGFVPVILGFSYQSLLPVFASSSVLNVGASGLGLMSTFAGIGGLTGSLFVASYTRARRRGLMQLVTGASFGIFLALFALSPNFYVALGALLFVGFTASVYRSLNSTMLTMLCEPEYYGRVMSLNMLGFTTSMLMPLPIGLVVDRVGPQPTIAVVGLIIALFVFAIATFAKSYRRLEMDVTAERGSSAPSRGAA